ncbi:hypothetical protein I79_020196 [Cricetulus griseus]|uniref:Uncharacterized protein n=1 Tax=Cricetulus griseus TaxID=10029 RepID=G3I9F5_CRIGR|nr:hypothetical protein I79_020196 [Cricetulus griseus]
MFTGGCRLHHQLSITKAEATIYENPQNALQMKTIPQTNPRGLKSSELSQEVGAHSKQELVNKPVGDMGPQRQKG